MRICSLVINLLFLLIYQGFSQSKGSHGGIWPTDEWKQIEPEAVSMDSEKLSEAEQIYPSLFPNSFSLLVIRKGQIVSESYFHNQTANTPNHVYSITKTIVASLLGIAIKNAWIRGADERVMDLLPEYSFHYELHNMTLEDILTHRSGLQNSDELLTSLNQEPKSPPGVSFEYSNQAPSLLTLILNRIIKQEIIGGDISDVTTFAQKYLFNPLGVHLSHWSKGTNNIPDGANGIYMTSRDLARVGYLLLRNGRWGDEQILPPKWVENSTKQRVGVDRQKSYGYLIWIRRHPDLVQTASGEKYVNGYFAYGHRGQFIGIYPELDLLVITTADTSDSTRDTYFVPDLLHDFVRQFIFASIVD